mmetsp:Transcript_31102/g.89933  ORF Transcript_31102/g.89933 Transcript_31102/m.89933 type:complete len:245 (-) Transcript_31102:164-898(-)
MTAYSSNNHGAAVPPWHAGRKRWGVQLLQYEVQCRMRTTPHGRQQALRQRAPGIRWQRGEDAAPLVKQVRQVVLPLHHLRDDELALGEGKPLVHKQLLEDGVYDLCGQLGVHSPHRVKHRRHHRIEPLGPGADVAADQVQEVPAAPEEACVWRRADAAVRPRGEGEQHGGVLIGETWPRFAAVDDLLDDSPHLPVRRQQRARDHPSHLGLAGQGGLQLTAARRLRDLAHGWRQLQALARRFQQR